MPELALFEDKKIRKTWHNDKWYFSVEDIVFALTDSKDPKQYINKMRKRDEMLAAGWVHFVHTLSMPTNGGNQRVNCVDAAGALRIIQSIPSPKAEPLKLWLAQVSKERIDEINNPELAADRMKRLYQQKGYSEAWIKQRERGIVSRHSLTDEWQKRGIKAGRDYAILTNEIYKNGFGLSAKEYKNFKNIHKSQNLRDSMDDIELALTNLGEVTATRLHQVNNSIGMSELKKDSKDAGTVINQAKNAIESKTKHSVISPNNYLDLTSNQREIGDGDSRN